SGHCLQDRIIAGKAAKRTVLAETGDAAMDQRRKALRQRVVADAPFLHRARLEILDQDVGAFQQAEQNSAAFRFADVERYGALVAVDADKVAGVVLVEWRAP